MLVLLRLPGSWTLWRDSWEKAAGEPWVKHLKPFLIELERAVTRHTGEWMLHSADGKYYNTRAPPAAGRGDLAGDDGDDNYDGDREADSMRQQLAGAYDEFKLAKQEAMRKQALQQALDTGSVAMEDELQPAPQWHARLLKCRMWHSPRERERWYVHAGAASGARALAALPLEVGRRRAGPSRFPPAPCRSAPLCCFSVGVFLWRVRWSPR